MNPADLQVRRATLDDLDQLRPLWHGAGYLVASLDKRLTEFQVVEGAAGELLGCAGLQIEQRQGLVHHVALCPDPGESTLLPRLWERVRTVAHNHGLLRLWVAPGSDFWREHGFSPPDESVLRKLPCPFGRPESEWLTLKLRAEHLEAICLEKEFDLFKQAQTEWTDRAFRQARALKWLAWVLLFFSLGLLAYFGWDVVSRLVLRTRH